MKIKNNTILCVFALTTLAATFGSCQSEDDVLNGLPQGSVPLVLGDVSVAGAQTVSNRAPGAGTRAAIAEDVTGHTGIRKTRFVNGDVLNLTLSNDGGTTNTTVTATLNEKNEWVLSEKAYVTPGTTTIKATYDGIERKPDITRDALEADTYTLDGQKVTLAMKHAGAMIDITPGNTDGAAITSVTVNADVRTVLEEEAAGGGGSGTVMHYRTIVSVGDADISSITAEIAGNTYVARLATPITAAANKRYPIALTFKHQTLTATVSAPQDWTNGGTVPIPGYDRIIDSPEALAQLAKDVNDNALASGTTILQTADIDLSKLKPADEAGINPLTGAGYTYTATKDNWVSIGNSSSNAFWYKYNGNGHTISNLKGSSGLFGEVTGGTLTGIHLRNATLTEAKGTVGALANEVMSLSYVALCSATGSITTITGSSDTNWNAIGGFVGDSSYAAGDPYISRCSADVDIDASGLTVDAGGSIYAGGFAGYLDANYVTGCMAAGDVKGGNQPAGGFVGYANSAAEIDFCMATGNVQGSKAGAFIGKADNYVQGAACYATGTVTGSSTNFVNETTGSFQFTDCAYTGTQTTTVAGITGSVAAGDLYATITASNALLGINLFTTLHWSPEDGYTLTEVRGATWCAAHIWKDNGTAAPTIDMAYEGTPLYNSQPAGLLAIPGKTAYWVTPVNVKKADGADSMTWDEATADGVCPDGWHVPSKEDFEAMGTDGDYNDDNPTIGVAFMKVFSDSRYWTSSRKDDTKVWCVHLMDKSFVFLDVSKSDTYPVRCVRKK